MKKLIYTLISLFMGIHAFAQIHTTDTTLFDSLVTTFPEPGVQHLLGIKMDSSVFLSEDIIPEDCIETGLKVCILNAEEDDIIGATVQVMDGEQQTTGGVTDFDGFLYLPDVEPGTYTILIRHVSVGEKQYLVRIPEDDAFDLLIELKTMRELVDYWPMEPSMVSVESATVTTYTTEQLLNTPSFYR